MKENTYDQYAQDLEDASDQIKLPKSVKTQRKGIRKLRDILAFYKQAWTVAEGWAGLPKALVYWLALTPLAIMSFNGFLAALSIPCHISLESGSTIAVLFVAVIMVFGFLAWTRFGLNRRALELGGKQNPNYYLFYKEFETIKKELREIKAEQDKKNE